MAMRISSSHSYADRGADDYATPPEATLALMRIEQLPIAILDPCCGAGAILDVLACAGHAVTGINLTDQGWPRTKTRDYLADPCALGGAGIVTNPPYRLAQEFIEKALADGATYSAWLLRTNFLESVRRKTFFEKHPPTRLWIASRRLPMMHRTGWNGPRAPSNQAYAWYVWDHRGGCGKGVFYGRPHLDWFDWRQE